MSNFVQVLGLESVVAAAGFKGSSANFEAIYDSIYSNPALASLRVEMEARIRDYFADLRLPDEVTLYDELLLALRDKDIVATFNWDPLLLQAYHRVADLGNPPRIVFLHGNVAVAYCETDRVKGNLGGWCRQCGKSFTPSPLLFPIRDKRYREHPFLAAEWRELELHLEDSFILTIFGYSAPASDVAAREILELAWKRNETQELAQIEIVDIQPRRALLRSWSNFIVRQHFGIARLVSHTLMYRHPRRSCDAFAWAILQNDPWPANHLPRLKKLLRLRKAVAPLVTEEILLAKEKRPFSRHTVVDHVKRQGPRRGGKKE